MIYLPNNEHSVIIHLPWSTKKDYFNNTVWTTSFCKTSFSILYKYKTHNIKNPFSLSVSDTPLEVRSIDLLKSNKEQNRLEHHTDRYHSEHLIIRRGQTFQMLLELTRAFNSKTDKLQLDLKLGQFSPT